MQRSGTFTGKLYRTIFLILFILYISFLAFLTLFGRFRAGGYIHRSVNIIPFTTILQYLTSSINPTIVRTNIWGNIEAFIPMGFLLPINFEKLRKFKKVLFIVLLVTVSIEVLQFITGVGSSDIDDVILNVIGGVLGYLAYRIFNGIVVVLCDRIAR